VNSELQDGCAIHLGGMREQYKKIKNDLCSSSSVSGGEEAGLEIFGKGKGDFTKNHQEVKKLCKSSLNDYRSSSEMQSMVQTASTVIAGSWLDCIRETNTGLSHWIETTPDPVQFAYNIQYRSDGQPYETTIIDWKITNSRCLGQHRPPSEDRV